MLVKTKLPMAAAINNPNPRWVEEFSEKLSTEIVENGAELILMACIRFQMGDLREPALLADRIQCILHNEYERLTNPEPEGLNGDRLHPVFKSIFDKAGMIPPAQTDDREEHA